MQGAEKICSLETQFAPDYFPHSIFPPYFAIFLFKPATRENTSWLLLRFNYVIFSNRHVFLLVMFNSVKWTTLRCFWFSHCLSAASYVVQQFRSSSFFTMLIDWFIICYHSHFHCYSIVSHQDLIVSLTLKKIFLALWSLINHGLLTMDYWPL